MTNLKHVDWNFHHKILHVKLLMENKVSHDEFCCERSIIYRRLYFCFSAVIVTIKKELITVAFM